MSGGALVEEIDPPSGRGRCKKASAGRNLAARHCPLASQQSHAAGQVVNEGEVAMRTLDSNQRPRQIGRGAITAIVAGSLLAGCAPGQFSTQSSRIGPDDGTDSCHRQLVALDSTGDFFGAQILTGVAFGAAGGALAGGLLGGDLKSVLIGAAAGGALGGATGYYAALQQQQSDQTGMYSQIRSDLSRENGQIDRTQLAFDQLVDCRFRQAQTIRTAYSNGTMDRGSAQAAMAQVKVRAQHDLGLAQQISQQISGRTDQFEIAADRLAPGSREAPAQTFQATTRQSAPLKLRPDPASPDIGRLQARQNVTVTGKRPGYDLVQTADGTTGFAEASAFQGSAAATRTARPASSGSTSPNSAQAANAGDVRSLAGSNAARRDDFAQSVAVTQQATAAGFELAS